MMNAAMRAMRMALALAAFFFFVPIAHAQFTPTPSCTAVGSICYQWSYGPSGPWHSTPQPACEGYYNANQNPSKASWAVVGSAPGWACRISSGTGTQLFYVEIPRRNVANTPSCPANSTLTAGQCVCNSGYEQDGNSCVVNQCAANAGNGQTHNVTVGWARSSKANAQDYVGAVSPSVPSAACWGGCRWALLQDTNWYRSTMPTAQGLYRISADALYIATATPCSETTEALNPNTAAPSCPGYVGEVNGVTTCVGSVGNPIPPATGTPPVQPQDPGNPRAGQAPPSGDGSGKGGFPRTPTEGTGGNGGGPAGAAIPSGQSTPGRVDGVEGQEQQACGAPGQPKCGIDETGTPAPIAATHYDGRIDAVQAEADAARSTIAGNADKQFFANWETFFSAPPLMQCRGFDLPNDMGAIDPCGVVDGMRHVMAFLWPLAALFLCLRMVKQVI